MRPIDTWAKRIDDPAGVPKVFRRFITREDEDVFPYTIFAPAERWGFGKSHPKLLQLREDRLSFLELGRRGVMARNLPLAGVTCVEMGRLLLRSWLKLDGRGGGETVSVGLEFNSTVEDLFRPLTERVRAAASGIPPAGDGALRAAWGKLEPLAKTSYKLANFAKLSIMPGEKVLTAVIEPAIRLRKRLGLHQIIVPAHLAILTDREVILISDHDRRGALDDYGGFWRYLPLSQVDALTAATDVAGPYLSVRLAGGAILESRFTEAHGEELRGFAHCFASLRENSPTLG